MNPSKIFYTLTDEAPALATYSLLPIIRTFAEAAQITIETSDISLAARILAQFPERLKEDQRVPDALGELSQIVKKPNANVIKLPNISASIPQLKSAIQELKSQGYDVPNFPDLPHSDEEHETRKRYGKVLGSAVNPVLREGNSDRRAPEAVKKYARAHPHRMGPWSKSSPTHVSHMEQGDFFSSEKSFIMDRGTELRIEFVGKDGNVSVMRDALPVQDGEVIDAAFMSRNALLEFFSKEMKVAKDDGLLLSLHLKATMMKVSDPIIFGHAVSTYFSSLFHKFPGVLQELNIQPNSGLNQLICKVSELPAAQKDEILAEIEACYKAGPELAMVNSDKGVTNLHVPSDVIIDASMPAMIREGGKMWGPDGQLKDTKALIPESTYATIYQEAITFCKEHGAFDPKTMGTCPNVGLMAQKAEEYGSHDKTFEVSADGTMRVVIAATNETLIEHEVEEGDIWRMCQTKDAPIQDWVKLGVRRARASGMPAIFWLDEKRAHDASMIEKVNRYLSEHDLSGVDIKIMPPVKAIRATMERMARGEDTIAVTGNVLRDYLTDLFPILEVGTSAKMLSIVPLMNGGGMFETGAGGSAPKHVQQFVEEGHLRWDSLGEFLALAVSLEDIAEKSQNPKAKILADALNEATGNLLVKNKSPRRNAGELDNRGSHFYLAYYWAEALSKQQQNDELAEHFLDLYDSLKESEDKIINEIAASQGIKVDMGGYYHVDQDKASKAMCPSETFNRILHG